MVVGTKKNCKDNRVGLLAAVAQKPRRMPLGEPWGSTQVVEDVVQRPAAADRCQLMLIAHQDDTADRRQALQLESAADHRELDEVDHRDLVNDQVLVRRPCPVWRQAFEQAGGRIAWP